MSAWKFTHTLDYANDHVIMHSDLCKYVSQGFGQRSRSSGTRLTTIARIFFTIKCKTTMLNTIDLFCWGDITNIPIHQIVSGAFKVATTGRTGSASKMIPFFHFTLFPTKSKNIPSPTVECPTAVGDTGTSGFWIETILAKIKVIFVTIDGALVSGEWITSG